MYRNAVVIPALNPPETFIEYVTCLTEKGFEKVLVVDDGSSGEYRWIFEQLDKNEYVTVIRHAKNLGKGRGLKNAFNYVLTHWQEEISGVITADSDGQHTVEDIIRLHDKLENQIKPALILGTRNFDEPHVPFKSKFGNKITSLTFALLYGIKLRDTQTGLRAIPISYMKEYLDIAGERFEYEMNVLIFSAVHSQRFAQSEIQTVYFDNNSETHFRPFIDSIKIYRVIFQGFFRYILSSLSAAAIDLLVFQLVLLLLMSMRTYAAIMIATVVARGISSLCNFTMNRNAVFRSGGNALRQAGKYYTLCIVQTACSATLVILLDCIFEGNKLLEKGIVDTILFLISYQIQRKWVFGGKV